MHYMICMGSALSIEKQMHELASYVCEHKDHYEYHLVVISDDKLSFTFFKDIKTVTLFKTNPYAFDLNNLLSFFENKEITEILCASGNQQAMLATRLAYRLGFFNVNGIVFHDLQKGIYKKAVYSNNLQKTATLNVPVCLSITKGFNQTYATHSLDINVISDCINKNEYIVEQEVKKSEQVKQLSDAKRVLLLGKGIGSSSQVEIAKNMAQTLNLDLAATRPVAYNAWVPMRCLVGISGSILSADLVLALGVRGAAALTFGISKVKSVIAVNHDKEAPIFNYSDVGLVMDCNTFMMHLESIMKSGEQDD